MLTVIELLYNAWGTEPDPDSLPDYLIHDPVKGHGLYCFQEGLRLGLLLAADAFLPEAGA